MKLDIKYIFRDDNTAQESMSTRTSITGVKVPILYIRKKGSKCFCHPSC